MADKCGPAANDPLPTLTVLWKSAQMAPPNEALAHTFAPRSVARSLFVAVIIGSILNGINQGDAFMSGQPLVIWKLLLTYFVPFAVASYGSYAAYRSV